LSATAQWAMRHESKNTLTWITTPARAEIPQKFIENKILRGEI
jgi:hypothetical protein